MPRANITLKLPILLSQGLPTALVTLVVCSAPLPFGSTSFRVVAFETFCLSVAGLFALFSTQLAIVARYLIVFLIFVACWITVIALQLLPDNTIDNKLVNNAWLAVRSLVDPFVVGSVSAVKDQPIFASANQLLCLIAVLAGYLVGRNRKSVFFIFHSFAWTGLAVAVFSILMFVFYPNNLLWLEKTSYTGYLTGTFVNPNTAAAYFGTVCITWLLLLLKKRGTQGLGTIFSTNSTDFIFYFFGFIISLAVVFLTGSRAGSVITCFTIACCWIDYNRWSAESVKPRLMGIILGSLSALLAIFLLGGRVWDRFSMFGGMDDGRLMAYRQTSKIIIDYPWLGTGLGSYVWIFPSYRTGDASIIGVWDHAHNTSLEIAAEMGLPFFALVAAAWLFILIELRRGIRRRKRDRIYPQLAFWATFQALVHSQIDFPLQIPGYAAVLFTVVGLGLAQCSSHRTEFLRVDSAR